MLAELQSACESLDDAISGTDPAVLSGTECATVVELLARCDKRSAALRSVAHFGRCIKAELRTALGLGDPPLFAGAVCSEEGCDRRYHLQLDQIDPVANGGPTSYRNLGPLCGPGHKEKTRRDREAGLLGPPPHPPADNPPRKISGETASAHRDTPPTGCASVTKQPALNSTLTTE